MKVQTILETYKRIPANSIKCVNEGIVIKGDNCVIRVIPNLKRELMVQVGDSFSTGFSFYENSSLAEFHHGTMKVPFNTNDIAFLKQEKSEQRVSKNRRLQKNKILKTNDKSKKQKDMRIDINDRFKDFLKNIPVNSKLQDIFGPVYMNIRMLCKEPLIMYSHLFKKDFFSNKPKERIVSENEMAKLQKQKEKRKLY